MRNEGSVKFKKSVRKGRKKDGQMERRESGRRQRRREKTGIRWCNMRVKKEKRKDE